MSIEYRSTNQVVRYSPRTEDSAPKAWAVVSNPYGHEEFKADLQAPGGLTFSMVRTVRAEGLAADVAADMWSRYGEVIRVVAEHPGARWKAWSSGKLAVRGAVEASPVAKSSILIEELAHEETALTAQKQTLHPVAAAMLKFLHGQVQLASLNGSTPPAELLPHPTYADPTEVVDIALADISHKGPNI